MGIVAVAQGVHDGYIARQRRQSLHSMSFEPIGWLLNGENKEEGRAMGWTVDSVGAFRSHTIHNRQRWPWRFISHLSSCFEIEEKKSQSHQMNRETTCVAQNPFRWTH